MDEMEQAILEGIPDLADLPGAAAWFAAGLSALRALPPSPEVEASFRPMPVAGALGEAGPPFHRYGDLAFRKLVLATLLADHACYPVPADQVRLDRLLNVMHGFPAGFRLWWAALPGMGWLPVGYTGWFPIAGVTFEILETRAGELQDRSLPVLPSVDPRGSFVYLFNYSLVGALQRTVCSRRLLGALADDIAALPLAGLAAITVSEGGIRVAERFGMRRSGEIVVEGAPDHVYTRRIAR